jgi:hypothetical protein
MTMRIVTGCSPGALGRRNVVAARWRTFQRIAVAGSTSLNRVAAVVRNRTAADEDATPCVVRRWRQCPCWV